MAIGTTAAIIGASVIGAGAGIMGSKSQSKAIGKASDQSAQAAAMQLQLGRESLGLQTNMYNSNWDINSPFVSRGNQAGDAINALLGLPAAPVMTSPLAASVTAPGAVTGAAPTGTSGTATGSMPQSGYQPTLAVSPTKFQAGLPFMRMDPQPTPTSTPTSGVPGATPAAAPGAAPAAAAQSPLSAMTNFANSAGMQFALQQGADQVNNGAAGNGWLQSGAALKALQQNGQDIALQQYFPMYTGLLGQQQAVGAGAASSIAGVGQNFANAATGINGQMGNAIGNNATNQGNLALSQGQNNANMWGQIGSSFGNILGAIR